jgi:hypothetical protein
MPVVGFITIRLDWRISLSASLSPPTGLSHISLLLFFCISFILLLNLYTVRFLRLLNSRERGLLLSSRERGFMGKG